MVENYICPCFKKLFLRAIFINNFSSRKISNRWYLNHLLGRYSSTESATSTTVFYIVYKDSKVYVITTKAILPSTSSKGNFCPRISNDQVKRNICIPLPRLEKCICNAYILK